MTKSRRERPFSDLGRYVRRIRERRELSQLEVARRAPMRNELLSRLELGENVEIAAYDLAARGLGFRGALDLFTSGGDERTRKLLRYWRALPDDGARTGALRAVKEILDDDAAPSAT